jgi:Flp pilus assembly protein TadG
VSGMFRRRDEGVSTVEFALVAPLLLLLLVGIIDVARGINAYVTVANASREGARYAMLSPSSPPSEIESAVRARVVPLDPSLVTVRAYYYDGTTFRDWPSTGVPASSPPPNSISIRVAVSYPWSAVSFVIAQFFGGDTPTQLTSSATVDTRR